MEYFGLFIFIPNLAWALSAPVQTPCPSIKESAKILLEAEASGYRHRGPTVCAKKLNEKYGAFLPLAGSYPSERGANEIILDEKRGIEQVGVIKTSKQDPSYKIVDFVAHPKAGPEIRDQLVFVYTGGETTIDGSEARLQLGCASLLNMPRGLYFKKSCESIKK